MIFDLTETRVYHELKGWTKPVIFQKLEPIQWKRDDLDGFTMKDLLTNGLVGHLWTADIHVSSKMPAPKFDVPEFEFDIEKEEVLVPGYEPKLEVKIYPIKPSLLTTPRRFNPEGIRQRFCD